MKEPDLPLNPPPEGDRELHANQVMNIPLSEGVRGRKNSGMEKYLLYIEKEVCIYVLNIPLSERVQGEEN